MDISVPMVSDSESRYRLLFENSIDGILLTSPDGGIYDANPSACRILGRTREQIIAAGREGLLDSSDPDLGQLLEERKRTGKAHGVHRARRPDGSLFALETSSAVFSVEGKQFTCTVIRDISARIAADAETTQLIAELQQALSRVHQLSGLLPICASCKKIRDEDGAWQQLETYIRDRSGADFTHGLCPACIQSLYPWHQPPR